MLYIAICILTKYIGVFRISCEVTLQLLRDNKDSLMSVLDAFVHDPLVEWEDEKRKLVRDSIFLCGAARMPNRGLLRTGTLHEKATA